MIKYFIKEYSDFYGETHGIGKYDTDKIEEGSVLADIVSIEIDKGLVAKIEFIHDYLSDDELDELKEVKAEDYSKAEELLRDTINKSNELIKALHND